MKYKNAIVLAAGYGMRMVPINTVIPKAFIEVDGKRIIERIIEQLIDVGIDQIVVVVGYKRELFEYLIHKYGCVLIENECYSTKNNLYSLYLAKKFLTNTYIVPSDVYCRYNPFSATEMDSWYMVSDLVDDDSNVRIDREKSLRKVPKSLAGNAMVGICYLKENASKIIKERLELMVKDGRYDDAFWEAVLFNEKQMIVNGRVVSCSDVFEFNTYEQLREFNSDSDQLKSEVIDVIKDILNVSGDEIDNICVLKKGMTNRSFSFVCNNKKYIMRIPGEGTDCLINRGNEKAVYLELRGQCVSDEPLYIDADYGYKITSFFENARVCNLNRKKDIKRCMKHLRRFHNLKLRVEHSFDVFQQLEFYEALWDGEKSAHKDYEETKRNVLMLKSYIDHNTCSRVLCHIDAIPDNFLFIKDENGEEKIKLIDWEYAGMADPHIDIAMFCIYSLFSKQQVDNVIDMYFTEGCPKHIRIKIYCYIAVCGLLWSNWCEYKKFFGVEFGKYAKRQYEYAKDYFLIVQKELGGLEV